MGRRGPVPQPTAIRLLRGNPGNRAINHDEPKPEPLSEDDPLAVCPSWLLPEAQALWRRIAPGAIRCGLLTAVDVQAFEMLCQAYARWRRYEAMTGDDVALAIAKGYRNQAVKERQIMIQIGGRFGFDPSSRSSITVRGSVAPTAGAADSKSEQFRRAKTGEPATGTEGS